MAAHDMNESEVSVNNTKMVNPTKFIKPDSNGARTTTHECKYSGNFQCQPSADTKLRINQEVYMAIKSAVSLYFNLKSKTFFTSHYYNNRS